MYSTHYKRRMLESTGFQDPTKDDAQSNFTLRVSSNPDTEISNSWLGYQVGFQTWKRKEEKKKSKTIMHLQDP